MKIDLEKLTREARETLLRLEKLHLLVEELRASTNVNDFARAMASLGDWSDVIKKEDTDV